MTDRIFIITITCILLSLLISSTSMLSSNYSSIQGEGMSLPSMTLRERDQLRDPSDGMVIYNTTTTCMEIYANGIWQPVWCSDCVESVAPTGIGGSPVVCENDYASLSVEGGNLSQGAEWKWYSGSCGGNYVGTGKSITVKPETNTMYYVRAEGGCSDFVTACARIEVKHSKVPQKPQPRELTAGVSHIEWRWTEVEHAKAYAWNMINNFNSATSINRTNFAQTNLKCESAHKLYVWAYNDCGHSEPLVLEYTTEECCVESVAPNRIAGNTSVCRGESTTLTVHGGSLGTGASWNWYKDECGENYFATGESVSVFPNESKTYYVRAEGECNTTNCAHVRVSVVTVADIPVEKMHLTAENQIRWQWEEVSGVTGYAWSNNNNFNNADKISQAYLEQTNLRCGSEYKIYVWAYNQCGNSSALNLTTETEECFECGVNTVTDIDNNTYNTIRIGEQCWFAENLKTTKLNDNTNIDNVTNNHSWTISTSPAYSWYNNDRNEKGRMYAALYNWYSVETGKLCPTGWMVPRDRDWKKLEKTLGMTKTSSDAIGWRGTNQGSMLKETGSKHWRGDNTKAKDTYNFTALPGGHRFFENGEFFEIGEGAYWWTATEHDSNTAWSRYLYTRSELINRFDYNKRMGLSVRCIRITR